MTDLSGKRALITGGTRGIGAAVVELFRACGADVVFTGSGRSGKSPAGCRAVDFSDAAATEAFAAEASGGEFDILVNCAGINVIAPFAEISTEDFDRIHLVNVRTPLLLCRALIPGMRERRWGRIVNVTSVFGRVSRAGRASYSASKFGLDGLTAALAAEVAVDGILANCVAPGFVETDMTRRVLGESGIREIVGRIPIGRLAQPAEIAHLICWMASSENSYVSGQSFVVDGGFTRV
jgi:NAD(P)-dependent dehydrogenase (short-subunit alcohol dehydrogenase family)